MASGIPTTRRATRGTRAGGPAILDENSHLRTTATGASKLSTTGGKDATGSTLRTVTSSRAGTTATATAKAKEAAMTSTTAVGGKQTTAAAARKRAAFGEVSNRNGSGAAAGGAGASTAAGKKVVEKKAGPSGAAVGTSSTVNAAVPKRRTRTSLAAEQAAADLEAALRNAGNDGTTSNNQMAVDEPTALTGVSRPTVASRHRATVAPSQAGRPAKTSTSSTATSSRSTNAPPATVSETSSRRTVVGSSSRVPGATGRAGPSTTSTTLSTVVKREPTHQPPPTDDDTAPQPPAAKRARTSSPEKPTVVDSHQAPARLTEFDESYHEFEDDMVVPGEEEARARAKDEGWEDLDEEDEFDPMMASEYVRDIFVYMQRLEITTAPNPEYMDIQPELQWKMRSILIDWLIEVHSKFRLLPETLFLAVNLVDRFLSARVISLVKLQLVGTTALFVAAKYEEVICPSITNFLYMADNGFEDEEILGAERYLLQTLDFDLSYPNPIHFLRRISKADNYDIQTRTVAKYYMEIACVDHKMLHLKPSEIAAGAAWLARHVLDRGAWNANLVHYSGYSEDELLPAAQLMLNYILRPKEKQAESFVKKYASKKYMKASTYSRDWATQRYRDDGVMGEAPKGSELRYDIESMKAERQILDDSDEEYY